LIVLNYGFISSENTTVQVTYLDTWKVFTECEQGGEGNHLAWLATTACGLPLSFVFPHVLTLQVSRYGNLTVKISKRK
jgi:hypothetical protein